MEARTKAYPMQSGRSWAPVAIPWLLLAVSCPVFVLFTRVAHLGHRPFLAACLAGFVGAAGVVFFFPNRRLFFFSLAVFALPRFATLISGRVGHNVLFPIFMGLAVGLLLHSAKALIRGKNRDIGVHPPGTLVGAAALWIAALFSLAVVQFYALCPLFGSSLLDREFAAGVSANYSTWLASHLTLSFLGPLLFVAADRAFGGSGADIGDLVKGAAAGCALNVIAWIGQEMGIARLHLGAADMGLASHRWPGLFSDTGSSAVLLPVALFAFAYSMSEIARTRIRGRVRIIAHRAWPILILFLACPIALRQGRAFLVGTLTAFAIAVFIAIGDGRRESRSAGPTPVPRALKAFFAIALTLLAIGVGIVASRLPSGQALIEKSAAATALIGKGEFFSAYAAVDQPRSALARGGLELFSRAPWTGGGLGSFAGGLAKLRSEGWELPFDNPSTLLGGLLAEIGLLGTAVLCAAMGLALRRVGINWNSNRGIAALLPFLTLPAFFAGYHILFHEFTALWAFPFLVRTWQDPWVRGKRRSLIQGIVLSLMAASVLFSFLALDRAFCR